MGMLVSFGALGRHRCAAGLISPARVVEDFRRLVVQLLHVLRQRAASRARLRQFLALADAGLLRFLGADTTVMADAERGRFVARSTSHPDEVVGDALVDARIATPSVSRSTEPLLRRLHARGEVVEEVVGRRRPVGG